MNAGDLVVFVLGVLGFGLLLGGIVYAVAAWVCDPSEDGDGLD